jgi:hypothetical protein
MLKTWFFNSNLIPTSIILVNLSLFNSIVMVKKKLHQSDQYWLSYITFTSYIYFVFIFLFFINISFISSNKIYYKSPKIWNFWSTEPMFMKICHNVNLNLVIINESVRTSENRFYKSYNRSSFCSFSLFLRPVRRTRNNSLSKLWMNRG